MEFNRHYYSVPYTLIQKNVDIRATDHIAEVFYKSKRVSSHKRDDTSGRYSTHPEHMPESHRQYAEWNPERFIRWAEKSGSETAQMVKTILSSRRHREQDYRASRGLMRLETRYGKKRLEAACKRALVFDLHSYKGARNILDDWLRNPVSETHTTDLLEIMEDRYKHAFTILITQVPISEWRERFGNPTLSEAIMNRVIHNPYRLEFKGESMRKRKSPFSLDSFRPQGDIMKIQCRFAPTSGRITPEYSLFFF